MRIPRLKRGRSQVRFISRPQGQASSIAPQGAILASRTKYVGTRDWSNLYNTKQISRSAIPSRFAGDSNCCQKFSRTISGDIVGWVSHVLEADAGSNIRPTFGQPEGLSPPRSWGRYLKGNCSAARFKVSLRRSILSRSATRAWRDRAPRSSAGFRFCYR